MSDPHVTANVVFGCETEDAFNKQHIHTEDTHRGTDYTPGNTAASRVPPLRCSTSCTPDLQNRHTQQSGSLAFLHTLTHGCKVPKYHQIKAAVLSALQSRVSKEHATEKTRTNSRERKGVGRGEGTREEERATLRQWRTKTGHQEAGGRGRNALLLFMSSTKQKELIQLPSGIRWNSDFIPAW